MSVMSPVQIQPRVSDFISKPRKMMINGQWVDSISGKTFPTYDPATGKVLAQVAEGAAEDIGRCSKRRTPCFRPGSLAQTDILRAWSLDLEARRLARAESGRIRAIGKPGQWQAAHSCACCGCAACRRSVPLHGRMDDQDRGQHDSDLAQRRTLFRVYLARASRSCRPDHSLELPAVNGCLEAGSSIGRRMHSCSETR